MSRTGKLSAAALLAFAAAAALTTSAGAGQAQSRQAYARCDVANQWNCSNILLPEQGQRRQVSTRVPRTPEWVPHTVSNTPEWVPHPVSNTPQWTPHRARDYTDTRDNPYLLSAGGGGGGGGGGR